MDIKERLEQLYRNLDDHPQDWWKDQYVRLLDIITELNERQFIVGNVISEIQRVLENNPLKLNWPDPPQEELKPCPFCGSGVWQDGHEIVHCPVCKVNFNMKPRDWNKRSNA